MGKAGLEYSNRNRKTTCVLWVLFGRYFVTVGIWVPFAVSLQRVTRRWLLWKWFISHLCSLMGCFLSRWFISHLCSLMGCFCVNDMPYSWRIQLLLSVNIRYWVLWSFLPDPLARQVQVIDASSCLAACVWATESLDKKIACVRARTSAKISPKYRLVCRRWTYFWLEFDPTVQQVCKLYWSMPRVARVFELSKG